MTARRVGGGFVGALLAAALATAPGAFAATLEVNTDSDLGDVSVADGVCDVDDTSTGSQCSLRAAIQQANAAPVATTGEITFDMPFDTTIEPTTPLPQVTRPIYLDASTQPIGKPTLDGSSAGAAAHGLQISAGGSFVRGLTVIDFAASGMRLLTLGGNVLVENTIRGNGGDGIRVDSGADNRIGFPNQGNVIVANQTGVNVLAAAGARQRIQGNLIGTDGSAATALGNRGNGVTLSSGGHIVGGTHAADRNVISGNAFGVVVQSASSNRIEGNLIGTNAAGSSALGNTQRGVSLSAFSDDNAIGPGNVISANGTDGVSIGQAASGNTVAGNRIGTDAAGTSDLGNGAAGVSITGPGNTVGGDGDAAADGNLISGNAAYGVLTTGVAADQGADNEIAGNTIGTDAAGTAAIPNGLAGVRLAGGGGGNVVRMNRIARNDGDGVLVTSTARNTILGNAIQANGSAAGDLGIDLQTGGVTPNDPAPDADSGANGLQNFPVLALAETLAAGTHVRGTLASEPGGSYRVELFGSPSCDTAGHGEGATFLGHVDVSLGAAGEGEFAATVATASPAGHAVTATATDAEGNTSEFSACRTAEEPAGPPQVRVDDLAVGEAAGDAVFTVSLDHASASAVEVAYATANGGASAPADYASRSGTVTFAPGEFSKTVAVPVTDDALDEDAEDFELRLINPTNATIADATGRATIQDDDAPPVMTITGDTVAEGHSGQADATLTVTLDKPSGRSVSAELSTGNVTARAPDDYIARAESVTFEPGDTEEAIQVAVVGDVVDEPDETFVGVIFAPRNASLASTSGATVTIQDDDARPTISIADASATEGEIASFAVTLSGLTSSPVSVAYTTSFDSAGSDDFAFRSGTIRFEPHDVSEVVTVPTADDSAAEPNETFDVLLSAPSGATLVDGSAVGTIVDDDDPVANIVPCDRSELDRSHYVVALDRAAAGGESFTVSHSPGTASGGDYGMGNGSTHTFAAGEAWQEIGLVRDDEFDEEPYEEFTVTLSSLSGLTAGRTSATCRISDDDPPPVVTLGAAPTVTEGDAGTTELAFGIRRTGSGSERDARFSYRTVHGSAGSADYTARTGTVDLTPGGVRLQPATSNGTTVEVVKVPVAADGEHESDETVKLELFDPVNVTLGTTSQTGTIVNDDPAPPMAGIADLHVHEPLTGDRLAYLEVTLDRSAPASGGTLGFTITHWTSTAGDVDVGSGTLAFEPGDERRFVAVNTKPDRIMDGPKRFYVDLTPSAQIAVDPARNRATGTILDQDPVPSLWFHRGADGAAAPVSVSEGDAGWERSLNFRFERSGSGWLSSQPTFWYATKDGTATAPSDYKSTSGLRNAGQSGSLGTHPVARVPVPVKGDRKPEFDETVELSLERLAMFQATDTSHVGTIRDDDGASPTPATLLVRARVPVKVECPGGFGVCRGVVELSPSGAGSSRVTQRPPRRTLGRRKVAVGPGRTTTVRVKLNRRGRAALRRRGRVRATVTVQVRARGGRALYRTSRVTLRRHR